LMARVLEFTCPSVECRVQHHTDRARIVTEATIASPPIAQKVFQGKAASMSCV